MMIICLALGTVCGWVRVCGDGLFSLSDGSWCNRCCCCCRWCFWVKKVVKTLEQYIVQYEQGGHPVGDTCQGVELVSSR